MRLATGVALAAGFKHRGVTCRHARAWCQRAAPTEEGARSRVRAARALSHGAQPCWVETWRAGPGPVLWQPQRGAEPGPGSVQGVQSGAAGHWDRGQRRGDTMGLTSLQGTGLKDRLEGRCTVGRGGWPRRQAACNCRPRPVQGRRGVTPRCSLGQQPEPEKYYFFPLC